MPVVDTPAVPSSDGASTLTVIADVTPPDLNIRLRGEIDLTSADLLDAVTHVELGDVTHVKIDLSGLHFADLAGLRALLAFRGRHTAGDRVVTLTEAQPAVRRLFELAGHGHELAPAA